MGVGFAEDLLFVDDCIFFYRVVDEECTSLKITLNLYE